LKGTLNMSNRPRKALKAVALFLAFAIVQISVQVGFAEPGSSPVAAAIPQALLGRLVTTNNQPILVNGASAATGANIVTGVTITTPDAVGATINLGALGEVDLAPNTTIELQFDEQTGTIRVKLIRGCAIVRSKKGAQGEISTEQGSAGTTDKKKKGILDVCFPPGASAPTVGQGAAAAAGAGAGAPAGGSTAAATSAGLSTAAKVAIGAGIAAVAIGVPLSFRGTNSSVTTPSL
jgi:hypothetical protein